MHSSQKYAVFCYVAYFFWYKQFSDDFFSEIFYFVLQIFTILAKINVSKNPTYFWSCLHKDIKKIWFFVPGQKLWELSSRRQTLKKKGRKQRNAVQPIF